MISLHCQTLKYSVASESDLRSIYQIFSRILTKIDKGLFCEATTIYSQKVKIKSSSTR